ncbi:serine hydrolase [Pilimelia terevasa]|uniref:Serine hydrolase n=1 Tax=Pilimelia terevasa TaxID=53372 RepID=A0A8J3FLY3_9ACTN|nr:serine hydrolase [Pilimelia terevasa]
MAAMATVAASAGCGPTFGGDAERVAWHPAPPPRESTCEAIAQRPGSDAFYESNRPYVDRGEIRPDPPRATPASQGVDPARLARAAAALDGKPGVRSLLVLRNGRLVYERYLHGGSRTQSNNVHSASKGIIQALVGIAVAQGKVRSLDVPAAAYVPAEFPPSSPKRAITLRQLLTMSSGLSWTEDSTEHSIGRTRDWVKAIIDRPYRPAGRFNYSTGNTHVLSAVLQAATGMSTCAYAERYLFGPAGITPEHWGRDPRGVYSGGFNLFLTARELARFGQLYLDGGRKGGRQVVPASTVRQAGAARFPDAGGAGFGYGSGWWVTRVNGHKVLLAWGWGGQYVAVVPDLRMVVTTTQDTQGGGRRVDARELDIRRFLGQYLVTRRA